MDGRSDSIYDKIGVRTMLLKRRAAVLDRADRENAATNRVLPLIKGSVMIYASIGSELGTTALFNALKENNADIYLPYTENGVIYPRKADKLTNPDGLGNLKEYSTKIDMTNFSPEYCVVPLVGINAKGYRLGYGKGCYDRFFASNKNTFKIGFAFDCQFAEFSVEPHDIPLDCCVTESKVVYF